jgi:hypothetical protein
MTGFYVNMSLRARDTNLDFWCIYVGESFKTSNALDGNALDFRWQWGSQPRVNISERYCEFHISPQLYCAPLSLTTCLTNKHILLPYPK